MAEKAAQALMVKRTALARVLGCSTRQIGTLEADKVIAPARRGKAGKASLFDLFVAVPAYLAHELGKQDGSGLDLEHERALLAREQRRKCAAENRKRSGELLERADVVFAGRQIIMGWRAKVLALPRWLALEGIIPREREADVKAACRNLLTDIGNWKVPADIDKAVDVSTALIADDLCESEGQTPKDRSKGEHSANAK